MTTPNNETKQNERESALPDTACSTLVPLSETKRVILEAKHFPLGWWMVFSGAHKLGLADHREPIAAFRNRQHAETYGKVMWAENYEVEQVLS